MTTEIKDGGKIAKRILIFSGTSDGRLLSERLAASGFDVSVSVATEYGREEQGELEGVSVLLGRLVREDMTKLFRDFDAIIDATHPYATEVTENIRSAAAECGKSCYRLAREKSDFSERDTKLSVVSGKEDAVKLILDTEAEGGSAGAAHGGKYRIMLTTGSKDIAFYAKELGAERLWPRVLPSEESIALCEAAGIAKRNIIAMQGPFTRELNEALIRQFEIDMLLTKDSGSAGGFGEKCEAAAACGIACIVISRPEDAGLTAEEITEVLR